MVWCRGLLFFPVWTPNWCSTIYWKHNSWPIGLHCHSAINHKTMCFLGLSMVSVFCLTIPYVYLSQNTIPSWNYIALKWVYIGDISISVSISIYTYIYRLCKFCQFFKSVCLFWLFSCSKTVKNQTINLS